MQTEEKVRVIVDVSGALCQEELDNSKQKKTVTSLIQPLPLPTWLSFVTIIQGVGPVCLNELKEKYKNPICLTLIEEHKIQRY